MEKLSKNLRAIIEAEAQSFEELAIRLYIVYEGKLILQTKHFFPDDLARQNYRIFGQEMENNHIKRLKDGYSETKKPCPEIEGFLFPDNIIFDSAINLFSTSEPQVSDIKNLKEISESLIELLSLKSYLVSKLYKNFDAVCSIMESKPDDLFHDIWLLGDTIKTDSHFLIGYRMKEMDRIWKAILSAEAKTKKAEKNIEAVKNLLLEKHGNKASQDFYIDAMKATGRGERTIKEVVKKIREELKKGKTDGIS